MSARFSDAEAAEIDAARGSTDRGPWLRLAALAVARPGDAATAPRPPEPQPGPEPAPKNCKHPRVRGKGVCPDCHEWVASKP